MHKYYHNNFSANKQNRDAQTLERGGSPETHSDAPKVVGNEIKMFF
jgi:hypothetical protein